jgi:hypothetical protein
LFGGFDQLANFELTSTNIAETKTLPPKPRGLCKGKTGMELVVCQRYIETIPPTMQIFSGNPSSMEPSSQTSFNLDGGYNLYMLSKYATQIQNQGREGACSAFGNAHVLGVLARIKGKSGEYDAWKIWSAQGRQPYMTGSIAAAKRMDFDGLKITSTSRITISVASLKAQLDSGRPIYYGSGVDSTWHGAGRGNIGCSGATTGRHAYAIMGYDDSTQQFVIKNSWGDSWGDQGYGYLSYNCIGKQGITEAYDIQLN